MKVCRQGVLERLEKRVWLGVYGVAGFLLAQGVDPSRMSTRGMGPDQPVASNATVEGRAQNRRVEVTLRPLPGVQ